MAIPSKDSHRVGLLARRATAHERMSRVRRRRLYGRATDQIRPLAVERRQPLGAHCDDPERRRSSQAISGRHAALGRRSALAAGRGRGGGIRLGRRPCRNAMSPPIIGRLPFSLQTPARWLRSGGYYGRQLRLLAFSEGLKAMIIKQLAALAVFSLALSGCAPSLNNAAAGGATAVAVTGRHWCRDHRFYRYDLVWHLHHCGHW